MGWEWIFGNSFEFRFEDESNAVAFNRAVRVHEDVNAVLNGGWLDPRGVPNDDYVSDLPMVNLTGALELLNLYGAWNFVQTDHNIIVATLDTGVAFNETSGDPHEDLVGNLWQGESSPYTDCWGFDLTVPGIACNAKDGERDSHGTRVSGVVAAVIDNDLGIAGTANVKLMPVKMDFRADLAENAVREAVDQWAKIVVMSWGFNETDYQQHIQYIPGIEAAIRDAYYNESVLFFGAVPNDATLPIDFPANMTEVIAVGSVGPEGEPADNLPSGPELELLAPGFNVFSAKRYYDLSDTDPNFEEGYYGHPLQPDNHQPVNSSSLANAFAAGTAALVKMAAPSLTNVEVRQLLQNSTVDLGPDGRDDETGFGRLDAWRAVTYALGGDIGSGGDAGDEMADAQAITGCGPGCDGFLNESHDDDDWYTFNVDDPYNGYNWLVDIDVQPEPDDDLRIELRNSAGVLRASSDGGGEGASEAILYEVTPSQYGDFYLLVHMKPPGTSDWEHGWGRYTVTLSSYVVGLKGHVTDDVSGAAVSGASVRAFNGGRSYSTTTDSSGYYEVTVYPGDYTVEAWRCDYYKQTTSVSLMAGWTTRDFQLQKKPTGTLYGYVRDQAGVPLNNANVRENLCYTTTTTNSNGYYSFTVYAGEEGSFSAYKTGYWSQTKYTTVPPGGSKRLDFTLQCRYRCWLGPEPGSFGDAGKALSSAKDHDNVESMVAPALREEGMWSDGFSAVRLHGGG